MSHCSNHFVSATLLSLLALPLTYPARADSARTLTLDTVVVTSTREAQLKRDLPESVSVMDDAAIMDVAPSHPAELLNRVPGVHVNNLGGMGSHGWQRGLFSAGAGNGEGDGVILNLNLTDSDGYQRQGNYQRQSATLRLDAARIFGGAV